YFTFSYSPLREDNGKVGGVLVTVTETTSRVKNEKALKLAQAEAESVNQDMQNFFMQSPNPLCIVKGSDYVFALANQPYLDLIIHSDIVGKRVRDVLSPSELMPFLTLLDGVYQTGIPFIGKEIPFRRDMEDGTSITALVDFGYHPLRLKDGTIYGIFASIQDVTEHVKARKRAEENEAQLRLIMDSSPALIAYCDSNERYLLANAKYSEWLGISAEEILGKTIEEVIGSSAYDVIRTGLQSVHEGKTFRVENTLKSKTGGVLHLDSQFVPYRNQSNDNGFVILAHDVTESALAKHENQKTTAILDAIINNSSDIIFVKDRESRMLFCNPATLALIGKDRKDVLGKTDIEFLGEMQGVPIMETDRQIMETGLARTIEEPVHDEVFLSEKIPFRNKAGEVIGLAGISKNITTRIRSEAELKQALSARDEFLSIASHELKTPLTTLQLQLQLNLRKIKPEEGLMPSAEKLRKFLNVCVQQTNRLEALVNDLLDVSRIQQGKLGFRWERVNLSELAKGQIELFTHEGSIQSVPITLDAPDEIWLECDRFRIEQVLVNLLTNAIKYGETKPIHVSLSSKRGLIEINVQDSGIGIERDKQSLIFDRFERAIDASHISGLGLGLYIVKFIVSAHEGTISVESKLGQGSVFTVRIPAARNP
ncbi:MAG: PAS domain-containing protein, partial [Bdellovibrionales bacterium]|nr:PAS domain-containing protein [Oligoflexia bacterium]